MKFSKYNLLHKIDGQVYLLFNTLTGHCFQIDLETVCAIRNNSIDDLKGKAIYEQFTKYAIIIEDNIEEDRIVKYFQDKSKFNSDIVSSTILLAWSCNLACVYCYEGAASKRGLMTLDTADRFIKFMINQSKINRAHQMGINLFGGEPLTNINVGIYVLEKLKKYCYDSNINFFSSMITNGTLLNEKILNELTNLNCKQIQITLDGAKKIHDSRRMYKNGAGSFDKVISSIELLRRFKDKIHTVIRINVDKSNLSEALNLLEYIGDRGEKFTYCTVDFGIVRGSTQACSSYSGNCFVDSEVGEILSLLWTKAKEEGFILNAKPYRKWLFCGLYSDSQFTVSPEGDIYKCWEHTGDDKHKIGEIGESGEISNIKYTYYDWMSHDCFQNEECKECVYLPVCGGGCGVVSYNNSGSYHDKGCFKVKGVVEQQIRRMFEKKIVEFS